MAPIRGINDFRDWPFDGMRLDEDIYEELDSEKNEADCSIVPQSKHGPVGSIICAKAITSIGL